MAIKASPAVSIAVGVTGIVSAFLLTFTAHFEGTRYVPYQDPAVPGLWTVCRGVTNRAAPGWVKPGRRYTESECADEEAEIIQTNIAPVIDKCRKVAITQRQWEMLVDFAWNVGPQNVCYSTLMKKLNAGDCLGAADQFEKWDNAGGRRWTGLIKRRKAEAGEFRAWCGKAQS
ncbi:lysozyme [Uliginosibacterium gangwonense]|uniref:lysozyme n=1 Tax=Uliginosibacterium gangwonense TaxID=392736 RepID=UPI000683F19D|nr:lysozyme [Uliginosibacterium gangwonense]